MAHFIAVKFGSSKSQRSTREGKNIYREFLSKIVPRGEVLVVLYFSRCCYLVTLNGPHIHSAPCSRSL